MLLRRRDTTRIIYDILCIPSPTASKYKIISKANLSSPQADNYLSILLECGHLDFATDFDGKKKYSLSLKGERLRSSLRSLLHELEVLFPYENDERQLTVTHHIFTHETTLFPNTMCGVNSEGLTGARLADKSGSGRSHQSI